MLKIVYPICCGLDVHKTILIATIAKTDDKNITTYETREFTSINSSILSLKQWLLDNNCKDLCMESTGKYWIPVFNLLEDSINVFLVHPKYVKAIKGKKTDKKDSKWIADLFKHDLVQSSFIPPADIRALRDICRYRYKLVNIRTGEKNRVQNCMTVSNIGIDKILTDCFGKSGTNIMKYLIENKNGEIDNEKVKSLLNKCLKKKSDQIIESINGSHIKDDQLFKLDVIYKHLDNLNDFISAIENELINRANKYQTFVDLACELPGIDTFSAIWIVAEIGTNMDVFQDAKHLTSWAGLTPTNNESAGKKHSTKISHAGCYIKPLLIQCALCAIKVASNKYYYNKYISIKKRRGHKKAIIAIARMMLTAIYYMFKTGENWNPYDYEDNNFTRPKRVVLNNSNVLEYLSNLGIDTTDLTNKLNELNLTQL